MTKRPTVWLLPVIAGVTMLAACEPTSKARDNSEKMEDAARTLTFSDLDNVAYMLNKISGAEIVSGVRSKVAVFFGYYDNRAACKEVAYALTERSIHSDEFDCDAID